MRRPPAVFTFLKQQNDGKQEFLVQHISNTFEYFLGFWEVDTLPEGKFFLSLHLVALNEGRERSQATEVTRGFSFCGLGFVFSLSVLAL